MNHGPPSSEVLFRYIERALELQENGVDVSVTELCREHPDLAPAVLEALSRSSDLLAWASHSSNADVLTGRVLSDRYRLDDRIGVGAMGVVYRAADLVLKRKVAVKIMQPHLFGGTDAEQRFHREAEALAALHHPNIVAVHDRGTTDDGLHFLVMELLEGVPLSGWLELREDRQASHGWDALRDVSLIEELVPEMSPPERSHLRLCARWTADLAAGLDAAHQAGIYHRDVKPSNVFLTRDGSALLLDFGIAVRDEDVTLTLGSSTLGTPKYMPPEQVGGRVRPSPQLDVYSLAASLYHMACGRPPYSGDAAQVLLALQRREPRRISSLHRPFPADLEAIVETGMARNPQRRYATAAAFERDLRAFLAHRPVSVRRRGPIARAWRWSRSSRVMHLLAVGVVILTLALAIPAWLEARARGLQRAYRAAMAKLPPTLALGAEPVIAAQGPRQVVAEQLDLAIAAMPGDPAALSLRAAFRWDHGDPDGAAEDIAALAAVHATPYGKALAARYAELARARSEQFRLDGLPAPTSSVGRYLAAFHAMRANDYAAAVPLLEQAADLIAAVELGLIARLVEAMRINDEGALRQLHDDALKLEGYYGGRTTRTRHVMGSALVAQASYAAAIEPLRDAVAMAPQSYPTLVNLGTAYRRVGNPEDAEQALRRAIEIRPTSAKALATLAKVLAELGRFDEAREVAGTISDTSSDAWRRLDAVAFLELEQALGLFVAGDDDRVREHCARAAASARAVLELGRDVRVMEANLALCRALEERDSGRLSTALLRGLVDDPLNVVWLGNLVEILPEQLGSRQTRPLREYLRALVAGEIRRRESAAAPEDKTPSQPEERHR